MICRSSCILIHNSFIILTFFFYANFHLNDPPTNQVFKQDKKVTKTSYMKTLSTSASSLFIRISKNKFAAFIDRGKNTYLILNVVEFCANNCHDGLRIDDDLNTVIEVHNFVELFEAILPDVVHAICETVASLFSKADLQTDLLLGLRSYL